MLSSAGEVPKRSQRHRLEIGWGLTPHVGSNPTLSANFNVAFLGIIRVTSINQKFESIWNHQLTRFDKFAGSEFEPRVEWAPQVAEGRVPGVIPPSPPLIALHLSASNDLETKYGYPPHL
jgi:hypothetical protein